MENQKTKLSDFANDESTESDDPTPDSDFIGGSDNNSSSQSNDETENESTDCSPLGKQSTQTTSSDSPKQGNGPLCPTYHEEHVDDQWQQILEEYLYREPACGHAIHYLKSSIKTKISVSSAATYCGTLSFYVDFLHNRDVNVCEATIQDVHEYLCLRVRRNLSDSTVTTDRTAICNLYRHIELYRDAEATLSPALIREEIDPSSYRTKDRVEREPLTTDEIERLFDVIDDPRNRLIVQVALEHGPRNTDLCRLKVSDIDLNGKMITLPNTKAGGTYTHPLTDNLALQLRRWIEVERPALELDEDNPYLFPSRRGGSLSESRLCDIVTKAAERAGIQERVGEVPLSEKQKEVFGTDYDVRKMYKVDVHTLRHTYNNLLSKAGVSREDRSAALDHSDTEVTEEFYDHNEEDHLERIEELFDGISDFLSESDDDDDGDESDDP